MKKIIIITLASLLLIVSVTTFVKGIEDNDGKAIGLKIGERLDKNKSILEQNPINNQLDIVKHKEYVVSLIEDQGMSQEKAIEEA